MARVAFIWTESLEDSDYPVSHSFLSSSHLDAGTWNHNSQTIEQDRRMTMMTTTAIPCGAKAL